MPIKSVDDIRKAWGADWASASDEELLGAYSKAANVPLGRVADALKWGGENRGMWGNRGSAAVDSYQANMYGIGEALGSDWAKRKRIENDVQAQIARDWAQQQGAISSFKDVGGVGDFFNYAGGLALDSAPYLGEAIVGGLTGGATLPGTVARMGLGTLSRGAARTAGAVGASYPSAVGDILSNQRDQGGEMNLGSALIGGVPYAAANAFGVEGALARGASMKSGLRVLDDMTGWRGAAARTGASVGKGVLQEAPAETFQEGVNQYFGRMAVDPNETFFNERSNDRFMESAVGGGVLGGLFGGGMGGWRRSNEWYAKKGEEERRLQADSLIELARQEKLSQALRSIKPAASSPVDFINGRMAPNALGDKERGAREKEYEGMLGAASGRYVVDPATQQERELTVGELLDMEDRARNQRDYTKESGTPLLGYDPRVVNPMPSQFNMLPNGQAVDPEQFGRFDPLVQSTLLRQGLFSPVSGLNAANAISQPAGPFTPGRVDMLLGLPAPLTEAQKRQKQKDLESTLGESSGVRVQNRATGVERELSMSEFQALQAGQLRLPVGFNVYMPDGDIPGQGVFSPPDVVNVNPFGQAGGTEQQNQTLLADTTDLGTELARQRIAAGYVAPTGNKDKATASAPVQTWANQAESDKLGLPKKPTPAAKSVFDQAVAARDDGTLDGPGFLAVTEPLKGGKTVMAKTTLKAELNRVAGVKALAAASAAPAAPKTANIVVNAAPAAPAAPSTEPANQLLQGQPDGSVATVAGQRTGGSSAANGAVDQGGVAVAGRDPAPAVGAPAAASRVEANDRPAQPVADGSTGGAQAAVAAPAPAQAAKKATAKQGTISQRLEAAGKTAVEFGVVNFKLLKNALQSEDPRMHHAVRLTMGIDKDGDRLDKPLSVEAAATRAGLGKNRSELSKVLSALGLDRRTRERAIASSAQANERAEGDIGQDTDLSQLQAEYIDESEASSRRGVSESDLATGAAAEDFGRAGEQQSAGKINSVGGSQGNIAAGSRRRLQTRKFYQIVREKGLAALSLEEVVSVVAQAAEYADSTNKDDVNALRAIFQDIQRRRKERPADVDRALAKAAPTPESDSTGNEPAIEEGDDAAEDSGSTGRKFGKSRGKNADGTAKDPYTAADLTKELAAFMRTGSLGRNVIVVDSVEDLLTSTDPVAKAIGQEFQNNKSAFGVAEGGKAYLIANRINKGSGRAKFMHEVGSHLGLDKLLPKATFDRLVNQIREWARKDNGSPEYDLAWRAVQRVFEANTPAEDARSELVAYFIEMAVESGIDPTAAAKIEGPLGQWFRTMWAAFKDAIRKIRGVNIDKLTAQDVVNLAYGAARLEIAGTWHGTAAEVESLRGEKLPFRNFRNKYIGTGEGATAFGWGTYLAQRFGIGKTYWEQDVKRKSMGQGQPRQLSDYPGKAAFEAAAAAADYLGFGRMGNLIATAKREGVEGMRSKYGMPAALDKELAAFLSWAKPEGSLMRVDTAVVDSRMYDYDETIDNQNPEVRQKLLDALSPAANEIKDLTNLDVGDLTGKLLIGQGENELGILSQLLESGALAPSEPDLEFNRAAGRFKYHAAASHYLRTLGLDGIKFLDARSRGTSTSAVRFNGQEYNRDDLRGARRDARQSAGTAAVSDEQVKFAVLSDVLRNGMDATMQDLERGFQEMEDMFFSIGKDSAARYKVTFNETQAREKARADAASQTWQGKQLIWLQANKDDIKLIEQPKTRNLVIFNDKNIFRVGAQVAADRQRMKFGKEGTASPEAAANAQTQPVATAERAIRAYPAALRPAARAVHRVLGKYARGALNTVMFTEDLMSRAIDLGMKSAKAYKDLANQKESFTGSYERRVLNTVSGYNDLPEKLKGKGPGTVNAFLQDSQMQSEFAGKWGYQPSWLDKVEIDPKAKAAYEALGDKGRAYADSVFRLGHDTLALKKQTVIESTTSEYDVLIAAAAKDGNTAEVAELTAEKAKTLEQFGTMMKLGGKFPYSPVKRFGNYVVVAESQKYRDARMAGDTKLMRQLEGDPNEYFVDFAESDGDAQKIEDELRATGLYVDPGYRPRETMRDDLYGGSNTLKALSKLRERAAAMPEATSQDKQTKEAATKLRTLLTDLYLMQLAEGSSRKAEMKRRGVAGNIDMIRSLETQGKADAHFLGSVKFGGKMLESIGEMRKEMRDGNRDERLRRSEALNEIIARHLQSMDYKETPLVDALRMVPSVFFLAMSPSYYIQNALQPFMLSLPVMAARHGYGKTAGALTAAYKTIAPAFKNADVFSQIDFDALLDPSNTALTKDEKAMVQSLLDSGRLDIGLGTEFGTIRADGDGKVSAAWNRARDGLQGLQTKMEALNRLSTALAAFRLGSGDNNVTATEYADRIIQETHGNYNAQNAPRAFNTAWGKIGLQFKKYQLIQLTLMAKLLKNSFAEAKTKEEKDARALARKALAYTMGQAAVIGGGKALPIPFVVAWLFGAAFGDDSDEPPEYVLRQMIGNKDIADLLISGPLSFAGINGSGLGGFGNAVAALPFVDVDLTSREGVMETAFAIGAGPLGGLSLKTADAVGAMANGDYFKGLGMLLPKGPGSLIKAGEQMVNGVYQRDGDITMSADEISGWALLQQSVGFTPQQTLERQYRQQSAYKIDGSMRDQNAEIKRMYSRALKTGESTAEAKDAWMKYQAKRVNMGYERQPMSELTKSAKIQSEREKETIGGVQYRKTNREFVENLSRN